LQVLGEHDVLHGGECSPLFARAAVAREFDVAPASVGTRSAIANGDRAFPVDDARALARVEFLVGNEGSKRHVDVRVGDAYSPAGWIARAGVRAGPDAGRLDLEAARRQMARLAGGGDQRAVGDGIGPARVADQRYGEVTPVVEV